MFEVKGNCGTAVVYQDRDGVEEECVKQIQAVMDSEAVEGSEVRIMPDLHAGAGICIGFTQKLAGRVVPNFVGVDIGCGMLVAKIERKKAKALFGHELGLERLDKIWRNEIPMGMLHRKSAHSFADEVHLENLITPVNKDNSLLSIGTLGGGNHFGELDVDGNGDYWFVIHSGSRHLGLEVAKHWQTIAKQKHPDVSPNLAWLEGDDMEGYLNDMKWAQEYAVWNREAMFDAVVKAFDLRKDVEEKFCTIHNYIDTDLRIVRKGAISLQSGETAIIPMNMSFGSLVVKGKGNPDWNYSGPHGAGRVLSRRAARETLKMEDFKASMEGIYTTSVSAATIDESPMAYKTPEAILDQIGDSCEIVNRIKPVWNVKAGAEE